MAVKTIHPHINVSDVSEVFTGAEGAGNLSYSCVNTEDKKVFGTNRRSKDRRLGGRKAKRTIPVFFAADDNYLPFLAVSLKSVKDNASKDGDYKIYILHSGLKGNDAETIMKLDEEGFSISFVDVSEKLNAVADSLQLRDYYTCTTYYRVFIAGMFPQYDKALYMDSDTIALGDVGELFSYELGDNLIGAVPDQAVAAVGPFREYTKNALGIDFTHYFNAGIILMNLKQFRDDDFYGKFYALLKKYKFEVAQDQDYLNVLCKGRVAFIDPEWNTMPLGETVKDETRPKIVHYNLTRKPWHYSDVRYQDYFWEYARKTEFYDRIMKMRESFTEEMAACDTAGENKLIALALKEASSDKNYFRLFGMGV